ncbi:hypothetical protein Dsin_031183 [Dipteronia sinensis]|uniref:Uncharacterized protein n=1 Tax=Dipteronia sinensis TaxID=43782 RepID=A0AAD9ZKS2_9ROSI|nr:hypothetical protein Dsin_031183 [Dipteronia sinensis]
MMKVNIKESSTVEAAQDTPKQSLWASNIDLVMVRAHTPRLFFYKPTASSINGNLLKEALSKALVLFYPLAGRLGYDENGRIEIQCNGKGVLFVEAHTDSSFHHLNDFTPTSHFSQLLPQPDYSAHISSYPLLLVQVTYFKCGGIVLGVGLHHILTDRDSTFNFINTWAGITRGITPSITPIHDRTPLRARVPPHPTFHHIEYDPSPSMNNKNINTSSNSEPTSVAISKITLEHLKTLKTKSRTECYSNYEVLAAHIWRCTCKARGLANNQETKLYLPVDGRSRLNPQLPPGYFGNAIFHASSIALSGDLQSETLMDNVERVHKAVQRMDDDYLRSAIDYIEMHPDKSSLTRVGHMYKSPNLVIINWSSLSLQDADFGWGPPEFMGGARVFPEGMAILLPNPTDDGSILLGVCLETQHLQLFTKYLYDFE